MKLLERAIVLLLLFCLFFLQGCQPYSRDTDYQMFETIMSELSKQNALHVSLINENSIDGISEEGVNNEIWKSSNNFAMTIHLPEVDQNTLFYDGIFYVQRNGKYEKAGNVGLIPDLWAGILDTASSDDISSLTIQSAENGDILYLRFKPDENHNAVISATIKIDAEGKVSSITTTAEWKQTIDGDVHTFKTIQTTVFLSYDKEVIDDVIASRIKNASE